jgi:quinol monooxygenase YgiN
VLLLQARITVDPEQVAEFERLACELWEATHRNEPGCRRYEYVRLETPGEYLALMAFDDHEAFLVHQASEHHTTIAAGAMRAMVRQVRIEFGAPVAGAFGVVDGAEPQPLHVDPSLRDHYGERYPPPDFSGWGA